MAQVDDNLAEVDALPVAHKMIVHEYGFAIYKALIRAGLRNPAAMRQLVHEVWSGARGSRRAGKPRGFAGERNVAQLDWLLIESGAAISAMTLISVLRQSGLIIVPMHPSQPMVDASMRTVAEHDMMVTKSKKHALRLRAAMHAAVEHYWPFLVTCRPIPHSRRAGNDAR